MFHRVLVALDTSARAPAVFRMGVQLAKPFGAKLVLFRAIVIPAEFPPKAAVYHPDALGPKMLADGESALRALAASASVDAVVRVTASAEPWRAIIDEADLQAADVIVVGSHGYDALDRILGTNAARVADRAHCLVVVVHEPRGPAPLPSSPYRTNS